MNGRTVPAKDVLDLAMSLDDCRYGVAELHMPLQDEVTQGTFRAKCSEIVSDGAQVFTHMCKSCHQQSAQKLFFEVIDFP